MLEIITFILELIGTVAFAASGALVAIEEKMDILGICFLGVTTAVGGGVIRDLILGHTPPSAFTNPIYAIIAILTALFVFALEARLIPKKRQELLDFSMLLMDSLGLAVFTVMGIHSSGDATANPFLLVFVGVVTGVGGGVLRDMMSGNTPYIFHKHFYCSASIIGAVFTALWGLYFNENVGMLLGAVIIFVLRILAAHYRWKLPKIE